MNSCDLISIVIPLFNAEKFLVELIDSIKLQSYTNWEALFIDDGSTDNSMEIIRSISQNDSRFKLIIRDRLPKGAPTCRNIGMNAAVGKYIIFLDADDLIANYCFQQRIDGIRRCNSDFCVFPLVGFREKQNDLKRPPLLGFPTKKNPLHYLIQKRLPFVVVTNIYKLEVLKCKNISWDENVQSLQDSDFNIECLVNNMSFNVVQALPDYFWRIGGNDSSITKQINGKKHFISHLYVFEKQTGHFKESDEFNNDFDSFIYFLLKKFIMARDYNIIKKFLKSTYFLDKSFYAFQIKLFSIIMICLTSKNDLIFNLLYRVLLPKQYSQIKAEEKDFQDDYSHSYSTIVKS